MRWPWKRRSTQDQCIVSWEGATLAYVRARQGSDGRWIVQQLGVHHQGADSPEDFARRLQGLGLKGLGVHVMLRPAQYQVLQIDSPPVPPDEMRAAARFQIRDMVSAHLDDITLDVMQVGDGQQKGAAHLFVVAARNEVIRNVVALGDLLHWDLPVIDIQETAQRNLQTALARRDGTLARADAAIVIAEPGLAVLTISANEELFFTRRLELPDQFLGAAWDDAPAVADEVGDGAFEPVAEYVPGYVSAPPGVGVVSGPVATPDVERRQRVVVEVQRSLDLWDRTWSSMPLGALRVSAGERSEELARWLGREIGQTVSAMQLQHDFLGLEAAAPADLAYCLPLLGVLLRTETRKL